MLNLICKIEIIGKDNKKISFDYCNQIEIKTSCKNLTDTATVKVPRKFFWKEKPLTDFITQGNPITISIGYEEYVIETLFKGYIKSIENNTPVVINCENEMWNFKKITVPAEKIKKFDLKKYIEKYSAGIKVDITENLSFGSLDITNGMSLAQALDKIMQTYPYLLGYFQDGIFKGVLSTKRWLTAPKPTVFDPERNIVSDSLKYTIAEDVKICMKAVSIQRDNTQLTAVAPSRAFTVKTDKNGKKTYTVKSGWEQRQEFCPQCTTQAEVQAYAEKRATEWLTDKMEGTITAFGVPLVRKGGLVQLKDANRAERNNRKFVIDGVDYTFGTGGYRQIITLGYEIK
ncbi:MAG: hypothetical protein LBT04_02040 [Prevotellaceae bacterium]|jgi:hypothetical protein|nr:hypothetical protein [Prevotellaceae bacterium]